MSISTVITLGYGASFGTPSFIVTLGYGNFGPTPPTPTVLTSVPGPSDGRFDGLRQKRKKTMENYDDLAIRLLLLDE